MEKKIEVYGILSAKGNDGKPVYLCLQTRPPRFLSHLVQEDETLRYGVDALFSEFGLDTTDIPKRPVRMIDVPGRNLTYVFLLECDYEDIQEFLISREEKDLELLGGDELTGEAKSWVEELEKRIP